MDWDRQGGPARGFDGRNSRGGGRNSRGRGSDEGARGRGSSYYRGRGSSDEGARGRGRGAGRGRSSSDESPAFAAGRGGGRGRGFMPYGSSAYSPSAPSAIFKKICKYNDLRIDDMKAFTQVQYRV